MVPSEHRLRPTSDRVRTVLFDVLGNFSRYPRVLDLFAGSGALGVEAISRGAEWVDFIEKDRRNAEVIKANLMKTHLEDHGRVVVEDAFVFLSRPVPADEPYDLILADPPYDFGEEQRLIDRLAAGDRLRAEGRFVLESSARVQAPRASGFLHLISERIIGESVLRFYAR